jgi:hypothetical protein
MTGWLQSIRSGSKYTPHQNTKTSATSIICHLHPQCNPHGRMPKKLTAINQNRGVLRNRLLFPA